ncbi:hypothetical protein [Streptomyces sp. SID5789]|nr:hypothetical protein [Streptomyces sp. SID5789]
MGHRAAMALTAYKLDFVTTLQEMLATLTAGTIARASLAGRTPGSRPV